ncbi:MAG TPA: biotin/lipoyl-binding protein, partial [Prolixibacteraceae bacterium]|nr:biotin/lipoyl-binding protein [Prolixibacteraceae bacterium]
MKKILFIIAAFAIFASCNKPVADDETAKRQQLKEYKQQLHGLEQQIETLEAELSATEEDEVVNVKVKQLETQPFEHFIEVTGEVEADLNINVSPETIGTIEAIYVTEGEQVSKDQALAKLNTNTLKRSL